MGLVAQPLDKVEHRITRRQLERVAAGHEEGLAPSIAIRSLGNGDEWNIHAKTGERLTGGVELSVSAINQNQIGPRRLVLLLKCGGLLRCRMKVSERAGA